MTDADNYKLAKELLMSRSGNYSILLSNPAYLRILLNLVRTDTSMMHSDMRQLWINSNKQLSSFWRDLACHRNATPTACVSNDGIWVNETNQASKKLVHSGFYSYDQHLPTATIDNIWSNLLSLSVTPSGLKNGKMQQNLSEYKAPASVVWNAKSTEFSRWSFDPADLIRIQAIKNLIADPSLLSSIAAYLGANVFWVAQPACWFSFGISNQSISDMSSSAQLYHFDYDSFNFVKVMIYLSDVCGDSGPHTYMTYSNMPFPASYYTSGIAAPYGRINDSVLYTIYSKNDEVKITGPRGKVTLVDTSGFHKGSPLRAGFKRCLLQLLFVDDIKRFGRKNTSLVKIDGSSRIVV